MKLQEQDFYHGAALMQIVEQSGFTALNKASSRYGHYVVNADRRLFLKYRSANTQRRQFTFSRDELRAINDDLTRFPGRLFVGLVCGDETICVLDETELTAVIDPTSNQPQWITVESPPGCSMRVWGSIGDPARTLPHNRYPRVLLT
jgi:hypothetical protein